MQTGRGTYVTTRRQQQVKIAMVVPDLRTRSIPASAGASARETSLRNVTLVFMDFHNDVHLEVECLDRLIAEEFTGALVYPSLEEGTPHKLLDDDPGGVFPWFSSTAPHRNYPVG